MPLNGRYLLLIPIGRLFKKVLSISGDEPYETLRLSCESSLDPDVSIYKEYHALIVRHAKEKCSGEANCKHCHVETPNSI